MEDSCLLNSVLQKVPQSLAFFSSLIFLFGWTSFLYPASLGILDATCPPTQAHTYSSPIIQLKTYTAQKHNLAQAPEKLASDSLSSWFPLQITSGWLEASFFGGPANMALGRIQALTRNCQVQFSKSGTTSDTSIYSQRRNLIYFPVTEVPWDHQCGQNHSHFRHKNVLSS